MENKRVLVVEDEDVKYSDIVAVLSSVDVEYCLRVERAKTATEAEAIIEEGGIDFMVLDISLNISAGSLGPRRGGFANLGGLNVAEKLFMLGLSVRTVVVTGFEYFPAGGTRQGNLDLVTIREIEAKATELFGADLLGCIRYPAEGWGDRLAEHAKEALEK